MKIAIIGAGKVGGTLAKASLRAGHTVTLTSRDPSHAEAKATETGARAVANVRDALKDADLVILAIPYSALDAFATDNADALAGKTVIDVTNRMSRPNIANSVDGTSAAEQLQAKAPKAKVVKALNYAFAARQAEPTVDGLALDGFVAADDVDAKQQALAYVGSLGFRALDAGSLGMARALEAMAILNMALQMQNGWPWQSGWKLIGPTPDKKA